jgi:hypothetical protein
VYVCAALAVVPHAPTALSFVVLPSAPMSS